MGIQAPTRLNVAANSVSSPKSCKNCFGSADRLWGQNRVPLPPAITTACNMLDLPRQLRNVGSEIFVPGFTVRANHPRRRGQTAG